LRLNKFISHNSKYSRREADRLIEEGLVKINRQVIKDFAYDVKDSDRVYVKGRLIKPKPKHEVTVVVFNKPKGSLVTKKDDRGRTTIYHLLSGKFRHFVPIGRLDYASEGLLLLTDNKHFATLLTNSKLPRVYNIKIDKMVTEDMIKAMREGLKLEDATAGGHEKSDIRQMEFAPFDGFVIKSQIPKYTKLKVAISEGKNRELRRFFAHFGANVLDLKRVSYGPFTLNNLPTGKTRYLTAKEYELLHKFIKEEEKRANRKAKNQIQNSND
jgi:23S rRNA pseudouridine2605 synthase